MKKVVAVLAFLASSQAFAVVVPGWERPVLQAEMKVAEATGRMADVKNVKLVMTKQDGRKNPTGMVLLIDDQVLHFNVSKVSTDECGSNVYQAVPMATGDSVTINNIRLVLTDHAGRNCRDVQQYQWVAEVEQSQLTFQAESDNHIELMGNPEPVLTTQFNH